MSDDEPLYVPEEFMLGHRMPMHRPAGYYTLTVYGRSGSILYVAHYPPFTDFKYLVPPSFGRGLEVHGFSIEWEE